MAARQNANLREMTFLAFSRSPDPREKPFRGDAFRDRALRYQVNRTTRSLDQDHRDIPSYPSRQPRKDVNAMESLINSRRVRDDSRVAPVDDVHWT